MSSTYKWHKLYKAALLETDWAQMDDRIRMAEGAIDDRKRELGLNHGGTPEENQAIADAIRSLNVLRAEAAAWPSGKSEEAS